MAAPEEDPPAVDAPEGADVAPDAGAGDEEEDPEDAEPRASIIAPVGAAAAAPPPPEPEPIALTAGTANFINAGRATIEQTMNTNPTIGPAMVPDWSPNAPPLIIQKQVA